MRKKITQGFRQLVDDEPGERFQNANKRWKGSDQGLVIDVAIVVSAIVLIIAGAMLSLVPGIPGILLGIPGLALIATRSRRMAIWLDWLELKGRKLLKKGRKLGQKLRFW